MNRRKYCPPVFAKAFGRAKSSRFSFFVIALACSATLGSPALGAPEEEVVASTETHEDSPSRPVPPPPVGVRFGEPLEGEHFRVAYQYERIRKQGLLIGDDHVPPRELFARTPPSVVYTSSPRSLVITTHTFQLHYSPHPRVTLVTEVPFIQKELETLAASGLRTEVETQGVGDIAFAMVVPFIRKRNESSHFHLGLDVPTGSIRRGGDVTRLPFDSQMGNGTVDLEWGWTYRGHIDWLSWGGQVLGRHPVRKNDLNYREGSRFEASLWGGLALFDGVSASLRINWEKRNNIRVRDPLPNASITDPSDNPKARGGTRLTISPGLSFEIPRLSNQRLAVEFDVPFHQDLDGPQLEQDWSVKAGWQWGF